MFQKWNFLCFSFLFFPFPSVLLLISGLFYLFDGQPLNGAPRGSSSTVGVEDRKQNKREKKQITQTHTQRNNNKNRIWERGCRRSHVRECVACVFVLSLMNPPGRQYPSPHHHHHHHPQLCNTDNIRELRSPQYSERERKRKKEDVFLFVLFLLHQLLPSHFNTLGRRPTH